MYRDTTRAFTLFLLVQPLKKSLFRREIGGGAFSGQRCAHGGDVLPSRAGITGPVRLGAITSCRLPADSVSGITFILQSNS